VPGGDGAFVVAHADGNLYVYEKNKDGATESTFPAIRDPTQFSVDKAKYSKVCEYATISIDPYIGAGSTWYMHILY
jgi:hypothetical protein